jgi:putative DNA primase/helicase
VVAALGLTTADLGGDRGRHETPAATKQRRKIAATYKYVDEAGGLLFEVIRYEPKDFRQRRPDGHGDWVWNLGHTRRVLYHLPQVVAAVAVRKPIFICEGEKDVEALCAAGSVATCSPHGAGRWNPEYSEFLLGADVTIVQDKDEPGRKHAQAVAASVGPLAATVRIVEAAIGKDAADHLAAGKDLAAFLVVEPTEPLESTSLNPGNAVNLTHVGNGIRFAAICADRVKYDPARGWLIYDRASGVYRLDDLRAEALAKTEVPRALLEAALEERDESKRKALLKWHMSSESRQAVAATLEMARSEPGMAARADDFDADPDLVCAVDCIIDTRTGARLPHDPRALMTRRLGTTYDPGAACPLWMRHLETVTGGSQSLARFIQQYVGMSLTGHTWEQCLAIFYGAGANGKSVTTETIRVACGTYATNADPKTFMAKRGDTSSNGLARLAGARLVTAAETGASHQLDEALVKQVTGSEPVTTRFLFREFFEFTPQFKLILSTNHKPTIAGNDLGIWRRIRLVPFDVTIPDADQDHGLAEKLRAELPGILAWMVKGCIEWRRAGRLVVPDEVRAATADYKLVMDPVATFLSDCTVPDAAATVGANDLYIAYRQWAERSGDKPIPQRHFPDALAEHGVKRSGREPGRGRNLYGRIRLSETHGEASDEAT